MGGMETGGVRPQMDSRVNAIEIKDSSSQRNQSNNAAPVRGDSVTLDNFIQKLVERLNTFFNSDKTAKDQFAQTVTELSMRANVKQTFEGAVSVKGDGARLGAYVKQTSEVSVQIDMRMSQARQVADAQAAAMDANPFSPEATSRRIADFALSFFPMYAKQNADKPLDQQLSDYQKMVEDAIGEGFSEAMTILGDMPTEVSNQIQRTRDLVGQKLTAFFDYAKTEADKTKAAASSGDWKTFVDNFFARRSDGNSVVVDNETSEPLVTDAGGRK